MTRSNLENPKVYDPIFERGLRLRKGVWVPPDNGVWDLNFPPYMELNPAGAVDILLPVGAVVNAGLVWLVSNISANTITFKSSDDVALTTAIVLLTLENAWIFATGSATQNISWRGTATALSS